MSLRQSFAAVIAAVVSAALVAAFFISPIAYALNTHSIDLENGSSQYLYLASASSTALALTGDITIEAWVKVESQPVSDTAVIASKYETAGDNRSYLFGYQDSGGTKSLRFSLSSGGASASTGSVNYTLSNGTWYHVAVAYSSSGTASFYVNGSSVGSASSLPTSLYSASAPFIIGASADGFPTVEGKFDGLIDDVRVWNFTRSATEIADDYGTELNGNETGLVGYWKLNNSLSDSSNSGLVDLLNVNSAVFSTDTHAPVFTEDLSNRKTVNESVTSSTVLQNDDHLKLSLAANTSYVVEGVIFASSTSATPDIAIAVTTQTGSELALGYTTEDDNGVLLASGTASSRISLAANTPKAIHLKGTIKTGSISGDVQVKWGQATSNAAATTVIRGSYLKAEAI